MSWARYDVASVDTSILERISEDDVQRWLVAKLLSIREPKFAVHALDFSVSFREPSGSSGEHLDLSVAIHCAGECASITPSVAAAVKEIRRKLDKDPSGQAREKKYEAERLLVEARDLEAYAAGKETAPRA